MILNWKEIIEDDTGDYEFYNGGWVKEVTGVDKSKSNGYAFEGRFVNPIGGLSECGDGLYIVCSIEGSRRRQKKCVAVFEIKDDEVTKVIDWVEGNDWALQIRDRVAELLDQPKENPLAKYSTEELLEELKRRGMQIDRA